LVVVVLVLGPPAEPEVVVVELELGIPPWSVVVVDVELPVWALSAGAAASEARAAKRRLGARRFFMGVIRLSVVVFYAPLISHLAAGRYEV
jgi:hypothetical protein